jgi:alanine-glyoxylate transaminase/serine-glyoxylate transaminase/serine-pyruvate transaminase
MHPTGRHFLQIPGPTNVPDRVLRAMDGPTIDHCSAEFANLAKFCLEGIERVFQTRHPVVIYPASGTGAWEAALVKHPESGRPRAGHFATLWSKMAANLGLSVEFIPGDWRHGVDPPPSAPASPKTAEDRDHVINAVMVVHNETSTGVTSNIPAVRRAIDDAGHPAL